MGDGGCVNDVIRVVVYEYDVGIFDGDVGVGVDCEFNVGLGECWCVVDVVVYYVDFEVL